MKNRPFARNVHLGSLLELFLVASVSAILLIRAYLAAMNYPQVGGGGLHIAHMLWGGLFMLIAIVMLLAFQRRYIKPTAALLGGAGFGTFIDELGKFITSDNNYFYQPTIAVIYVIFVLLLLCFRSIERHTRFTEEERLAAGLDVLKEGILRGSLRARDKVEILRFMHTDGIDDSVNPQLLVNVVEQMQVEPPTRHPGLGQRISRLARKLYRQLIRSRNFTRIITIGFLVYAVLSTLAVFSDMIFDYPNFIAHFTHNPLRQFSSFCLFFSELLANVLILLGIITLMRRKPLQAYRWFEWSVLISILLGQVFLFYQNQFNALWQLGFDLLLLAAIYYLIRAERREQIRRDWQRQQQRRRTTALLQAD
jgi:hypothetical protein